MYFDGSAIHSFELQSGTFTNIDPPGVAGSIAEGINNSGQVVGQYSLTDPLVYSGDQGYLLSSGSYTTINYPGAVETGALGLNSSGQIVGWYEDGSGLSHGFTDFSGTFSTIDYPGATSSEAGVINDYGQILGEWYGPAVDPYHRYDVHAYLATPIPSTHEAERGNGLRGKGLAPHADRRMNALHAEIQHV